MAKYVPYVPPPQRTPCECPDGYCAMARMAYSLKAEKAVQRMRDKAAQAGMIVVCRLQSKTRRKDTDV